MAQQATWIKVFVASPSDTEEEVACLEGVVEELNAQWENRGVQLRLVRWKTHVDPGFGDDPQAVVNQQVPPDCDIFMGILWSRIGSPTARAASGTIEEYERAKARFDEDPDSVEIMFFFKEAAVPLQQIDGDQIQAVRDFRDRIREAGGLDRSFETTEEFEGAVRLSLGRYLNRSRTNGCAKTDAASASEAKSEAESEGAQELGLLELQDEFEREFEALREVTAEIVAALTAVGTMMKRRTADMERAQRQPDFEKVRRKVVRNVCDNAAAGIRNYVADTEPLLPRFATHLDRGTSLFARLLPIQAQISKGDTESRTGLTQSVRKLRVGLRDGADSLEKFQAVVEGFPPMTTAMLRANKQMGETLRKQVDTLRRADTQIAEVESLIDEWIEEEDGAANGLPEVAGGPANTPRRATSDLTPAQDR